MKLVLPNYTYKNAYLQALDETLDETQETQLNRPAEGQSFADFVDELNAKAKGKRLPEGFVPVTCFWLEEDGAILGRVQIRHELNDFLLKRGGHIGYYIIPSARKKGYGKLLLQLGLEEAKKMGLTKVLVTCDEDNIGSRKIIETNGGVLENIETTLPDQPPTRRYWIDITKLI